MVAALCAGLLTAPAAAQDSSDPCANAPVANHYEDRDRARGVHVRNVDCVIHRSIAVGTRTDDGRRYFLPRRNVTRGQMASFLAQTLVAGGYGGRLPSGDSPDAFDDISGSEHRGNINRLARTSPPILRGARGESYRPNDVVRRQQLASFIVQAAEWAANRQLSSDDDFPFHDVSSSNVHRGSINRAEDNGLVRGVTDNRFAPAARVPRDQMASFLVNLLRMIVARPPAGESRTVQPELVAASVVRTVPQSQSTASDPAGTTVRYVFDEPIPGTLDQSTGDAAKFRVYEAGGTVHQAGQVRRDAESTRVVLVRFNAVDTTEKADRLSVATVNSGAVRDASDTIDDGERGLRNPPGDAALGRDRTIPGSGTRAGETQAPDLLRVENFREGAQLGRTVVDFVFDEPATVAQPATFFLITTGNDAVACNGPASGSTAPSGQTSPGGNGTARITASCVNPGSTSSSAGTQLNSGMIARAGLQEGTVRDTESQPRTNPLHTVAVSNDGNTDGPDLVGVDLQPSEGTGNDIVVLRFREPVDDPSDAAPFLVYTSAGNTVTGTGNPGRDPNNASRISVRFPDGTLATAAGVSVRASAVVAAIDNEANRQDSQALNRSTPDVQITAGRTDGPDLLSASINQQRDEFGNLSGVLTVYRFDEPLDLNGSPEDKFLLYTAGGTRLECDNASAGTSADSGSDTVRCSTYENNPGVSTVASAVLAVVGHGAVDDEAAGMNVNPVGAAATSGGTGQPSG